MKIIIIFLLMNFSIYSGIVNLKSFSSLDSDSTKIGYIDISKYDQNESMHLAIVVMVGKIDKIINYGFSDENPSKSNVLSYSKDTTSSESFCSGGEDFDGDCGTRYYYDIKKEENKKYLIVQCTGYTGESISFSFLPMSAIGFYILYIFIFLVCVGICVGVFIYQRRKAKAKNNDLNKGPVHTSLMPQDNQYSNY
mgnify:FL=1